MVIATIEEARHLFMENTHSFMNSIEEITELGDKQNYDMRLQILSMQYIALLFCYSVREQGKDLDTLLSYLKSFTLEAMENIYKGKDH